ncbi:DAZ interacting zinc finger protein 1 L homeolog isoform X10 [Xenopus laevis]|uniref:DAZ interacting zinc finger protein 1 L homeolog isoform X10 n=1 Tax=Xenopus laevis TaxID=8355 RepID=A0A8J1M6M1_XENLA|nr:DAZ interacting zinc finger protein 1 L homeolog isoform X10 [Xenopus laevis]
MPFYENVYYPFDSDNASSTPSILSSPCLLPSATRKRPSSAGAMFKFRTRHESMDWRRIGAIDVDRVANELDFITLQENVMSITFCNLEDEKCPHCKNSLDPILLKLFRLSQFTIEYLLHSQEYLTSSLRSMEEEVQAATKEAEQIKLKMVKQSEEIKSLKEECKRRKKMIASQQMMISASAGSYHKCNFCDKAFVNYSYLQSHMHRRHPQSADSEKSKQHTSEVLQNEISKLKNELQNTKCQLEAEKCAQIEKLSKIQEMECQKAFEQELLNKFKSWKEEEKEKHAEEIAKVKGMFSKELKELTMKNASLEQIHEMEQHKTFEQDMLKKFNSWKNEEKGKHAEEMVKVKDMFQKDIKELTMKIAVLEKFHETGRRKTYEQEMQKMFHSWKEEEKEKHAEEIAKLKNMFQKEVKELTVKNASLEKVKEQSVKLPAPVTPYSEIVQAPAPLSSHHSEIKPIASSLSDRAHILDPIEELTEEERDVEADVSSSQKPHGWKKNQLLAKELRAVFEEGLAEKLESLGVKPGARGIPSDHCKKILESSKHVREERDKQMPLYRQMRQNLTSSLNCKAEERTSPAAGSRSSTLHSKSEVSVLKSSQRSHLSDQRSSASMKPTKAKVKAVLSKDTFAKKPPSIKTPPFSSDDESCADAGPLPSCNTTDSLKLRLPLKTKGNVGFVESESDSEGSFLEELQPQWVSKHNVQKQTPATTAPATLVKERCEQIEKQPMLPSVKNKPVGGVNVGYGFASSKDEVMELKVADIDENEFDNSTTDEESFEVPRSVKSRPLAKKVKNGYAAAPVRNTFVSRTAKEDVVDTSSTLVSSLVTVSDFSDSSDT